MCKVLTFRNYNLIVIATLYCHTFEFIIGNFFPLFGSLLLLKSNMHIVTLSVWSLFRLLFTFEEHAGYDFPWHLNKAFPFVVCAEHHNFHHEKNIGNYSEFSVFWDKMFGTDQAYIDFKTDERREELGSSSPSRQVKDK